MRYAIISDVHANLAAFRAVLDDIRRWGGVDKFICLGDIVGYGPDPHECIETMSRLDHICVAGNHDLAAIGSISTEEFNPDAAAACRWTLKQLSASDIAYLEKLPPINVEEAFTMAHGSPREPVWEYLLETNLAKASFACFKTQFCLVGHTHAPLVFQDESGVVSVQRFADSVTLNGKARLIINPGAVGQPRDGDSRAAYAIYDSDTVIISLHRVMYDIKATQAKMAGFGLPRSLIKRLNYGL